MGKALVVLTTLAVFLAGCSGPASSPAAGNGDTGSSSSTSISAPPESTTRPTTTTVATTTTSEATTTTTLPPTWDSPECTILQAGAWFGSDAGSVSAFEDNLEAFSALVASLDAIGASTDDLYEQRGTIGISNWLLDQLEGTPLYDGDKFDPVFVIACLVVPEEEQIAITVDAGDDVVGALSQVFAGRFRLPGAGKLIGTRDKPIEFGQTAVVGEWDIRVVDVNFEADDIVARENRFNDPPALGNSFVLITLEATYLGSESDKFWLSIDWKALGDSNVAYEQFDNDCGVIPNDIDDQGEVFNNGTVKGNICFEVRESDVDSLLLILEESLDFSGDSRTFFALRP